MSRWLVLVAKLPAQPSRHRVGVWRELRGIGALSLGQGIWAVPDVPVFADGIARAVALTEQADGQVVTLTASGRGPQDADRLREMFGAARSADWAEFLADCDTFEAEIAKEIRIAKLTLAELEEEEQSLERLRRWHRDLTARDVFGTSEAAEAARAAQAVRGHLRGLRGARLRRPAPGAGDGAGTVSTAPASQSAPAKHMWPLYAAGFTTAFGAHGIAANLGGHGRGAVTSLLVLGGLLAFYDGAEVLLKPVFGTLADRIGARPVLLGGLVASAAASALYVVADRPGRLWAARPGARRGTAPHRRRVNPAQRTAPMTAAGVSGR
ncbi:Chromate resistance protein ChrB [Streptomyces lasalocidi]